MCICIPTYIERERESERARETESFYIISGSFSVKSRLPKIHGSHHPVAGAHGGHAVCDGVARGDFRVRLAGEGDPGRVLQLLGLYMYIAVSVNSGSISWVSIA